MDASTCSCVCNERLQVYAKRRITPHRIRRLLSKTMNMTCRMHMGAEEYDDGNDRMFHGRHSFSTLMHVGRQVRIASVHQSAYGSVQI